MLQEWIEDIKTAPERLKTVPVRARRRAHIARVSGLGSLWTAQTSALEAAESFFANAPANIPVISKVADVAEKATQERLEAHTRVCLYEYESLNAKQAIKSVSTLNYLELLRVKRLEEATKQRKTVLAAIEKAVTRSLNLTEETQAA